MPSKFDELAGYISDRKSARISFYAEYERKLSMFGYTFRLSEEERVSMEKISYLPTIQESLYRNLLGMMDSAFNDGTITGEERSEYQRQVYETRKLYVLGILNRK